MELLNRPWSKTEQLSMWHKGTRCRELQDLGRQAPVGNASTIPIAKIPLKLMAAK
jgi:hypothetical protein